MDRSIQDSPSPLRFPLFLDLTQKNAVVVGGGKIAARRVFVLLDFVRRITVIAPELRPELESLASDDRIDVIRREFLQEDLAHADLVITATGVKAVDECVWRSCRDSRIPVNVASDQSKCDFFFPGIARKGNLIAGVSACGADHGLAKRTTEAIRALLERISEEAE